MSTHQLRAGIVLVLLSAVLSSCSWTSGSQYFVHWGVLRDDVVIRQETSWDLVLARRLFHLDGGRALEDELHFMCDGRSSWSAANTCVLRLLNSKTSVAGLASGVWNRATAYDAQVVRDDFGGAMSSVARAADDRAQVTICLTVSLTAVGSNWTTRDRSHTDCRHGRHQWE